MISVCIPTFNYGRFLAPGRRQRARAGPPRLRADRRRQRVRPTTRRPCSPATTTRACASSATRATSACSATSRAAWSSRAASYVKFLASDDWLHPAYLRRGARAAGGASDRGDRLRAGLLRRRRRRGLRRSASRGVFRPGLVPGRRGAGGAGPLPQRRRDAEQHAAAALGGRRGRRLRRPLRARRRRAPVGQAAGPPRPRVARPAALSFLRFHRTKAHDYGLDPSESTFLALGGPRAHRRPACDARARAHRTRRRGRAQPAARRPAPARRRRGGCPADLRLHRPARAGRARSLARFALRLPLLARAQARADRRRPHRPAGRLRAAPRLGPRLES